MGWTDKEYAKKEVGKVLDNMYKTGKLSEAEYNNMKNASVISYGNASNSSEYLSGMYAASEAITDETVRNKFRDYINSAGVSISSSEEYESWFDDVEWFIEETGKEVGETADTGSNIVLKVGGGLLFGYIAYKAVMSGKK